MSARLIAGDTTIVVDRIFVVLGGKKVYQRGNAFMSPDGSPLRDRDLASQLPEPFKTMALEFCDSQEDS